ncbi:peptide/nickel transport system substrate-binding protein [Actinocorallia herbida]|uniref:Peptide/nickel transport system substrate-binding protein n=2 Tax=Actinocorallia herbida TaxID=58109 RepID=A0A3N1D246_9ACTN|nr:peptide/nickel transport system substrate-binding protein [Actinocorallia herbida]
MRVAAVAGPLALLLAACGGTSGSTGHASGPSGDPVSGGVLRAVLVSEPHNLDPAILQNNNRGQALLGNALYGTLLTNDPETGEVSGDMAEGFTTSDSGKTFVLTLRAGLKFSDGTPLDAAAVKYNWDRLKDPTLGSNSIQDASLIASTEVEDGTTLKVTLTRPTPRFGGNVILSSLDWIASPAVLKNGAQAFDADPVGAGPFALKDWTRGGALSLTRNPSYWNAPKPYLDGIDITFSSKADQRFNSLQAGGADVSMIEDWGVVAKARTAGLQVDVEPVGGGQYIALNQARAPFDDLAARQAVSAALDLDALNLAINQGNGEVADTFFPKSSPLYNDIKLHSYDKAKAQQMFDQLAAAGKPVSFTFTTFQGSEKIAEAVQAQLSRYKNVTVEVEVAEWADTGRILGKHDFDATVAAVTFQDPDPAVARAFLSTSPRNSVGIDDGRLDDALKAGSSTAAGDARKDVYTTAVQRLVELVPGIFYQREPLVAVAGTKVGGLDLYGTGSLLADGLWLSK